MLYRLIMIPPSIIRSIRRDIRRIESFAHQSSPKWIERSKRSALSQFRRGSKRTRGTFEHHLGIHILFGDVSSSSASRIIDIRFLRVVSLHPSLSRQFHLSLVRVSSTFRPDVLELLTKLWIIALCRRSGSSRLAMTLRSNRGSAPLSRAGESWRGATTNLWVWPRRRNGEPWSQWRKNSDDKAGSSKQLRKQEVQCCCYNNRKIRRFLNRALRVG